MIWIVLFLMCVSFAITAWFLREYVIFFYKPESRDEDDRETVDNAD